LTTWNPRFLAYAQSRGKPLSKPGNSVCPDVATALIVANFTHEKVIAGAAA
jgi:DNA (cytosine-5)-methyltransferase 1